MSPAMHVKLHDSSSVHKQLHPLGLSNVFPPTSRCWNKQHVLKSHAGVVVELVLHTATVFL